MIDQIFAAKYCAAACKWTEVLHIAMAPKLLMIRRVIVERSVGSSIEHIGCHQNSCSPELGWRTRVHQRGSHVTNKFVADLFSHAVLMLLVCIAVLHGNSMLVQGQFLNLGDTYSPAPSHRMIRGLCWGPRAASALVHTC